MKKIITCALVGCLLMGGVVYANEYNNVNTESELYETARLIEETEYELTEAYDGRALIQDEFADKRLEELEEAINNGNEEIIERLIEDINEHIEEIEKNVEEAIENGSDTEVETIIAERSMQLGENLRLLLEREELPQQAKEGIAKALENQERAMQRRQDAQERREQARERAREAIETARERAGEARETARERSEEVRETARERAEEERETARERAEEVRDRVENNRNSRR